MELLDAVAEGFCEAMKTAKDIFWPVVLVSLVFVLITQV